MKYFLFGTALALVTFAAYLAGDAVGYRDGKRDVAEHWWDRCRRTWIGDVSDADAIRLCSEEMPVELGLENTWGFR